VYRKSTWTGQYLNYHSFCPLQYKKALVKCLFKRIHRICTADTIEEERQHLTEILLDNNYPLRFIRRYGSVNHRALPIQSAPKKDVYISLPFRGDQQSLVTRQRLKAAINRTYYAAKLIFIEKTRTMLFCKPSHHPNDSVTSHCVYQFTCMCGDTYIGRTHRSLQVRATEHIPKWLQQQMKSPDTIEPGNRCPTSSIAKHIIETGHKVDFNSAFKPIYKTRLGHILKFIEALAIKRLKPVLCVQKLFVITLNLPW
ncbi:unnamed protein product, partial [Trichobilharzia szidati]